MGVTAQAIIVLTVSVLVVKVGQRTPPYALPVLEKKNQEKIPINLASRNVAIIGFVIGKATPVYKKIKIAFSVKVSGQYKKARLSRK